MYILTEDKQLVNLDHVLKIYSSTDRSQIVARMAYPERYNILLADFFYGQEDLADVVFDDLIDAIEDATEKHPIIDMTKLVERAEKKIEDDPTVVMWARGEFD